MIEVSSITPTIAIEDMTCYKLVYVCEDDKQKCKSSVYGTLYSIGGSGPDEEGLQVEGPYNDVTEGYPEFWNVKSGFASYRDVPVPYSSGMRVAVCKIPRGSSFLKDQNGSCYTSSKIVVEKIL